MSDLVKQISIKNSSGDEWETREIGVDADNVEGLIDYINNGGEDTQISNLSETAVSSGDYGNLEVEKTINALDGGQIYATKFSVSEDGRLTAAGDTIINFGQYTMENGLNKTGNTLSVKSSNDFLDDYTEEGVFTEIENPTGNPMEQGWYFYDEDTGKYEKTIDSEVEEGQVYYEYTEDELFTRKGANELYGYVGGRQCYYGICDSNTTNPEKNIFIQGENLEKDHFVIRPGSEFKIRFTRACTISSSSLALFNFYDPSGNPLMNNIRVVNQGSEGPGWPGLYCSLNSILSFVLGEDSRLYLVNTSTIGSSDIGSSAIITSKIANDAVTTDKIDDDAVTTDKITNGAVTLDKINMELQTWQSFGELGDNAPYAEIDGTIVGNRNKFKMIKYSSASSAPQGIPIPAGKGVLYLFFRVSPVGNSPFRLIFGVSESSSPKAFSRGYTQDLYVTPTSQPDIIMPDGESIYGTTYSDSARIQIPFRGDSKTLYIFACTNSTEKIRIYPAYSYIIFKN